VSYYVANQNGYLGDVASVGGLSLFREWAEHQDEQIRAFVENGLTEDPAGLSEALARATAEDPFVDGLRHQLSVWAESAEVLIISDGTTDDEMELDETPDEVIDPEAFFDPASIDLDDPRLDLDRAAALKAWETRQRNAAAKKAAAEGKPPVDPEPKPREAKAAPEPKAAPTPKKVKESKADGDILTSKMTDVQAQAAIVKMVDTEMAAAQSNVDKAKSALEIAKAAAYDGGPRRPGVDEAYTAAVQVTLDHIHLDGGHTRIAKEAATLLSSLNAAGPVTYVDVKYSRARRYKGRFHPNEGQHYISMNKSIPDDQFRSTFLHEMAHGIEHDHPAIAQDAKQVIARMFGGGARNRVGGGRGRVFVARDRRGLARTYGAKIYRGGDSTELLSTGIERYAKDPAAFAKENPEHFKFVYRSLRNAQQRRAPAAPAGHWNREGKWVRG
jgi:hypothetical protein